MSFESNVMMSLVIIMIFAAVCMVILIGMSLSNMSRNMEAFGDDYNYTLSESELRDQWVTDACMRLQINSPECDLVYGGITDEVSDGKAK